MQPPHGETWCSRCTALLEDSSADYVEGEDGLDALRMDLRNARTINGQTVCSTCHWQRLRGARRSPMRERGDRRRQVPFCGERGVPIVYGLPGVELAEAEPGRRRPRRLPADGRLTPAACNAVRRGGGGEVKEETVLQRITVRPLASPPCGARGPRAASPRRCGHRRPASPPHRGVGRGTAGCPGERPMPGGAPCRPRSPGVRVSPGGSAGPSAAP